MDRKWSIMEGQHCFPEEQPCERAGLTLPVFEYPHAAGNCSITGGHVYRGQQYGALDGA